MGLTPVEIFLYGVLAVSVLLLALLVLWHFARMARRRVHQWRASRVRKPDEFNNLKTENSRLRAEHAMMARKLQQVMEDARVLATEKEAEASRAINRAGVLEEELAAARRQIGLYEQSILEMGRQITDLRREISDTHDKAERIYQWRSELELRLQERKRELEKLRHELYLRADKLAATERKLEDAKLRLKESEAKREKTLKEQQLLSGQNETMRRELEERADIIRRLEDTLNAERSRFMREKMELQDKLTELASRLAEREAELLAARAGAEVEPRPEPEKERASA